MAFLLQLVQGWPIFEAPPTSLIGLLVLENKIFKCFFTIYGRGGHLGHLTKIFCINFG